MSKLSKKIAYGLFSLLLIGTALVGVSKIAGVSKAQAASCIITLFGVQYDVAPLQTGHPGGNIFVCGTDMTAVYQSMHGTDVTRMIPYLYTPPTATPTPSPVPTATPTPSPVPTATPTPTVTPSVTPTPTVTPTPGNDDDQDEDSGENDENETHNNSQQCDNNNDKNDTVRVHENVKTGNTHVVINARTHRD